MSLAGFALALPQLNLRDRVIEVTVAYVGGSPTSARIFDHVGVEQETPVPGGVLRSLEWRPRTGTTFNDCELALRLVRTDGDVSPETLRAAVGEIDGIVLVGDAGDDPRAVDTVRGSLAPDGRDVPVVLQKSETDEEGVMETLQRTVDAVMDSLQTSRDTDVQTPIPKPGTSSAHPLLTALRQVLQSTVSEQIAALEERLIARVEKAMAPKTEPLTPRDLDVVMSAFASRMDALEATAARLEAAMSTLQPGVTAEIKRTTTAAAQAQQRAIEGVAADVKKLAAAEATSPVPSALEALRERIDAVLGSTREVAAGVQKSDAAMARRVAEVHASLHETLHVLGKESAERDTVVRTELNAFVEESKKKKGWFT